MVSANPLQKKLLNMLKKPEQSNSGDEKEEVTAHNLYPLFYANDLNGYMGKFFQYANKVNTYVVKRIETFSIYLKNNRNDYSNRLPTFIEQLMEQFPGEAEAIQQLFENITLIGEEWYQFVQDGMNFDKIYLYKRLIRFSNKEFMDVVRHTVNDSELQELLSLLQPYNGDIGFNTMAGYLTRQFFDLHQIKGFWEPIYSQSHAIEEKQINAINDNVFIDNLSSELNINQSQANNITFFSVVFKSIDEQFDHPILSSINVDGLACNTIIWPMSMSLSHMNQFYKLDIAIPYQLYSENKCAAAAKQFLLRTFKNVQIESYMTPEQYEQYYGFVNGTGLRWALSSKAAMQLYSKIKNESDYSYWGYAWFTAMLLYQSRNISKSQIGSQS